MEKKRRKMMKNNISPIVLDVETNIKCPIGNFGGSPFWPENKVVLGCFYDASRSPICCTFFSATNPETSRPTREMVTHVLKEYNLIIGHNVKFDLLYLRKHYPSLYLDWVERGGAVWDTQAVEYLLSGQAVKYASLDTLSKQYGGTLKDDKIKEYWEKGIDTADIPMTELVAYLKGDVENTNLIFWKQWEKVEENKLLPLVMSQMDALLALVELEWNGIEVDYAKLNKQALHMALEIGGKQHDLTKFMADHLPEEIEVEVTPASPKQVSTVLFGGEVKCKREVVVTDEKGEPVRFKSGAHKGEVKTKKEEYTVEVPGRLGPREIAELEIPKGKSGVYSTDDEVLRKIADTYGSSYRVGEFCSDMLEWREESKNYSTYYEGLAKLLFVEEDTATGIHHVLHPNYNQCATVTGRFSSNQPNATNFSNKGQEDDD